MPKTDTTRHGRITLKLNGKWRARCLADLDEHGAFCWTRSYATLDAAAKHLNGHITAEHGVRSPHLEVQEQRVLPIA